MSADRETTDILSILDERSFYVYQQRTHENKSFSEIGAALGLTGGRARQLYEAGIKRIELAKSGGENKPEFSLGDRALHCLYKARQGRDDVSLE